MLKKLLKSIKPIQYITLAYAVLFLLIIIIDIAQGDISLKDKDFVFYLLFVLFIVGFSFSWYNEIITGIWFLLWYLSMWIIDLSFRNYGGFGIIFGMPVLVFGVLYIISGYKNKKDPPLTKSQQWKIALRLLATNYTILYLIFIIIGFDKHKPELFVWPGVILFGLLTIYLIGFLLSWKWELIAGILFIIWYVCLFIPDLQPIVSHVGPVKYFGLPVLIQGILYLNYHFSYKFKKV